MAAVEIFKSHDLVFSDRKCPDMLKALIYHQGSLAVIPYGTFWRVMRHIVLV